MTEKKPTKAQAKVLEGYRTGVLEINRRSLQACVKAGWLVWEEWPHHDYTLTPAGRAALTGIKGE